MSLQGFYEIGKFWHYVAPPWHGSEKKRNQNGADHLHVTLTLTFG